MAINNICNAGDSRPSHDDGGRPSGHPTPTASQFTVDAVVSDVASVMNALRQLRETDRAKFEAVMSRVLQALEPDASGRLLAELAADVQQAAETGNALLLQPADPAAEKCGHHHRVQSYAAQRPSSDASREEALLRLVQVIESAMRDVGVSAATAPSASTR